MNGDDEKFRFLRKWMYDMLGEFSKGKADYIRINEVLDEMKSDIHGKITFRGLTIDDEGNVSYFGSMSSEEFIKILSKFPEFVGKDILGHIKEFYQQGRQSLVYNNTLEVMKEDDTYRVVAELGSIYSPECKLSVRGGYGTISLEFECKGRELEGTIDLREKFEDGYHNEKLNVLSYHVSNNALEVLVEKV